MVMKKKLKTKQPVCKKGSAACSVAKKPVKKVAQQQIDKPYTKAQIIAYIAECVGLKRDQACASVEALAKLIELHLVKRGPGEFTLPGLMKLRISRKPAAKAYQGINPFTGKAMTYPAKPAHNVVKIKALKQLKDTVA